MKRVMKGVIGMLVFLLPSVALAAEEAAGGTPAGVKVALAIASGFAIAIAAFAGAFGQGKAVSSAMEGISRNPEAQQRMFVPLILGLAFIESLVIYAFVVSLMLQGKI